VNGGIYAELGSSPRIMGASSYGLDSKLTLGPSAL
jgi:hypothetical protein